MKVHYNKEDDILMIELVNKKIDDAYETVNMIVHVSTNREPVLLEIFKAKEFLKDINKTLPKSLKQSIFSQPVRKGSSI